MNSYTCTFVLYVNVRNPQGLLRVVKEAGMSDGLKFISALLKTRKYRFILSDTADVHLKMSEMSQRIRQLENALAVLQATVSNETHPLLSDSMKCDAEFKSPTNETEDVDDDDVEGPIVEALGTLSISDSGVSKYYGPSAAGFETLLGVCCAYF